jgi:hypothetical protein
VCTYTRCVRTHYTYYYYYTTSTRNNYYYTYKVYKVCTYPLRVYRWFHLHRGRWLLVSLGLLYGRMQTTIEFRCAESFKSDVKASADDRGLSVSEFLREAARKEMQAND